MREAATEMGWSSTAEGVTPCAETLDHVSHRRKEVLDADY